MRTYTERQIVESGVLKADDSNVEMIGALRQINGGIGQHQIPMASINNSKLEPPRLDILTYPPTRSTYGPVNSHHQSANWALGIDIDPGTAAMVAGWTPVYVLTAGPTTQGTVLEFTGREGMIRGSCQLDFERRTSYKSVTDGGTVYVPTHEYDWFRVGVFLNGLPIADSGHVYPKRYTIDLPFSYPAPAGYCRIETRFMTKTQFLVPTGTVVDGVTFAYPFGGAELAVRFPHIYIHGGALWCRNQSG